jgi:hypothetical protein
MQLESGLDLVAISLQDLGMIAPGQEFRVPVDVVNEVEHLPGEVRHEGRSAYPAHAISTMKGN